jgi:hypothetical protein
MVTIIHYCRPRTLAAQRGETVNKNYSQKLIRKFKTVKKSTLTILLAAFSLVDNCIHEIAAQRRATLACFQQRPQPLTVTVPMYLLELHYECVAFAFITLFETCSVSPMSFAEIL